MMWDAAHSVAQPTRVWELVCWSVRYECATAIHIDLLQFGPELSSVRLECCELESLGHW
jgi:hypothetical protein